MMRRFLFAILLLAAPLAPRPATAETVVVEAEEDRLIREIGQQLRCTVCQNESVADSKSGLAGIMRDIIRERLRAGESPAEIKAYFVSKYGDYILMEPRTTGMNRFLWAFPFVALLVGGALVAFRYLRRPASASATAEAAPMETDALINALRNPSESGGAPQEKS